MQNDDCARLWSDSRWRAIMALVLAGTMAACASPESVDAPEPPPPAVNVNAQATTEGPRQIALSDDYKWSATESENATRSDGRRIRIYPDGTWKFLLSGLQPVSDSEGNLYRTVLIGDRLWMRSNLRATRFSDGSAIPLITGAAEWKATLAPARAVYANAQEPEDDDGFLYNWFVVEKGNAVGLCPAGFHLPTRRDWGELWSSVSKAIPSPVGVGQYEIRIARLLIGDRPDRWTYGNSTGLSGVGIGFDTIPVGGKARANNEDFKGRGIIATFAVSEITPAKDPYHMTVSAIAGAPQYASVYMNAYDGTNPKESRTFGVSIRCVSKEKFTRG